MRIRLREVPRECRGRWVMSVLLLVVPLVLVNVLLAGCVVKTASSAPVVVVPPQSPDQWVLLGERTVNFKGERDEIPVTAAGGVYRRIKIQVRESGVEFGDVTVVFGNGERFDVSIRQFIPAGGETRVIDLPGKERIIQKIVFKYRTEPAARHKATVLVWGLREAGPPPPAAVAPPPAALVPDARPDQWVLLGETVVSFKGERDEIPVTSAEGQFKRIKIQVKESGVEFGDVTVLFRNGEKFDVSIRQFIPAGGETRVIDLPGKVRIIQKIIFKYKTEPGARHKATVVVWGLRD